MPRLSFGRFYTSRRRLFKMRPPPIPFLSTPDLQFFSPQTEVRFRTIYPRSLKITKAELQLVPLLPAPWFYQSQSQLSKLNWLRFHISHFKPPNAIINDPHDCLDANPTKFHSAIKIDCFSQILLNHWFAVDTFPRYLSPAGDFRATECANYIDWNPINILASEIDIDSLTAFSVQIRSKLLLELYSTWPTPSADLIKHLHPLTTTDSSGIMATIFFSLAYLGIRLDSINKFFLWRHQGTAED